MCPDLAGGSRLSGVLVHLDVLVVPRTLPLPRRTVRGREKGRHERPVHRVLVEQGRRRLERGEQEIGDRGLTGAGRPGYHPSWGRNAHKLRMLQLCAGTRTGSSGLMPGSGVCTAVSAPTLTGKRNSSSPTFSSVIISASSAVARKATASLARCSTVIRARTSHGCRRRKPMRR